jgi:serine/threonine protein kinase
MGEVYRALDTNLARQVAIKILPDSVAHDHERLARFEREAKTLAALNHPNIAQIYGLERSDTSTAIAMELVEGLTLADRIGQGAIPVDEALPIAKQIAEALEAAHERRVIHRDLKPANIKVRSDGTVKVLDFGLAKALEPASERTIDATASPTITSPALMTGVGVLLGTAAYMSPEQAKGRAVGERADIWALGAVLFEMLTGKRAFAGEDVADTLAFVLTKEPDWTALPTNTPASIKRLLRRCLEKDRKRRLADSADARLEIEEALAAPFSAAEAPQTRRPGHQANCRKSMSPAVRRRCSATRRWRARPAAAPGTAMGRSSLPLESPTSPAPVSFGCLQLEARRFRSRSLMPPGTKARTSSPGSCRTDAISCSWRPAVRRRRAQCFSARSIADLCRLFCRATPRPFMPIDSCCSFGTERCWRSRSIPIAWK